MTEQPERPQRSNETYPWMKPRHILPTDYPEQFKDPYPGYVKPEGTPWYQSLHREISTPEGGGYFKNQYTFDYNGKKYNVPLDERLAVDVGFPQVADQYRYGINYSQYTPANSRLYWSNPQRVARIKTLIDSMPEGEVLPDWLDVEKINSLYNYMEFLNPNKPYEEWAPLSEDDPAYNMLYNIPQPPQDMVSPYERDPVYASNTFLQDYQKRYSEQNVEASIKRLMESRGITFPEAQVQVNQEQEADFNNLEPAQKWLVAKNSLVPKDSNAPDWMKNVSMGSAVTKAAMGGFGATSMLVGGGTWIASMVTSGAITGSSIGPWGTVIGATTALGMGLATYIALKRGDEVTATKLLQIWNKPAEWVEQILGSGEIARQMKQLGLDPTTYDFADLWEAGKGYYETELYSIGNLEANLVQSIAHNIDPEWSSGLKAGNGEVWQIQKGIVEPQAIKEGFLVGMPLVESVIRLSNGENVDALYWEMVDRYGYSGTRADYIAQNWIDPLQYVPFMTSVVGEQVFDSLKMPMLAKSFQEAGGNIFLDALPGNIQMPLGFIVNQRNRWFGNKPDAKIWRLNTSSGIVDTLNRYRSNVANQNYFADLPISAYGIDNMTTFGKVLAGIDPKTNMPVGVPQLDSDGKVIASRYQKAFASTPQSAIGRELYRLNSMFAYQGALHKDPISFMESMSRLVEGAEYVSKHPNDPLAYAYDSPDARALRSGLKAAIESDPIKTDMALWKASEGKRQAIKGIAEALSLKPENVIQMMKNGEYSKIIEQLSYSTNVKHPTVEAVQAKTMTAESLKKSMDVYVKNGIPYYPEMMTVRLENRLTDLYAERLGKAYDLDLKQQGKLWKWVGLNKSVQSLALLNTPNFVMKNLLNNMVTMGYDGIGSLFTTKHNDAIMARYGLTAPDDMKIGYGSIGKLMATPETTRTVVDQLQTWTNEASKKIGIFTKMAGNIEGKAKYTAYANAVQQGFDSYYKDALPKMPAELRKALSDNQIDPDVIEKLVLNMTRAEQFDAGPDIKLADKAVLSDAMQSAIDDLGTNSVAANDLVNKLSIMDNAMRYMEEENMSVDTSLERVFQDLKAKALEQYATEVASAYEEASQDVNTSGWGAFLKIVDDLDIGPRVFQMEIAEEVHQLTIETSRFRKQNPTAEGRKLANEYYLVRKSELDDRIFLENKEAMEKTMAIVHRLNPDSEVEATLANLLLEKMHLVQDMQEFVMDENSKYWGADEQGDYEDTQAKVRKGQQSYSDRIETLNLAIDNQILKIFNFDKDTKQTSEAWVQRNRKMREELAGLYSKAFKNLEDSSEAGRRAIWQRALDKRAEIIAKYSSDNLENNEKINKNLRKVKHEGPTPPTDAVPPEPDWSGAPMYEPAEQMPSADTLQQITHSGQPNYQGRNKRRDRYTLDQGPMRKGLEYVERKITRAASEIEMIDNKYRGRWFKDNAVELKAMRAKIQDLFGLSDQEGQMVIAMLARKAEDSTFRLGDMQPMNYMRRYRFEETSGLEMGIRATILGVKSKGTGSIDWDIDNAKWIIKAVKGKADMKTLLHELIHTWIFDLDRGDMIALNEIYKYGTVEELYSNHRGWLTKRRYDGENFDGLGFQDYSKRTEEVVKIAEEYFYRKNRGNVIDPDLKGIPALLNKFRVYVVDIMDKYRGGWSDEQSRQHKMWVANTLISPTVEHALNRLYEGYRMDKVWDGGKELKRAPVMGTMLADIFGLNTDVDAKYLMYDVAPWHADKVASLIDKAEMYKAEKVEALTKATSLLPPNLDTAIPAQYADNKILYGHPGADEKSYVESRQDLLNSTKAMLEPLPEDVKKITALSKQLKNDLLAFPEELAKKYIVNDPDGKILKKLMSGVTAQELEKLIAVDFDVDPKIRTEWQRARYKRELEEVYAPFDAKIYESDEIIELRDKIVYWSSFRDSGLYGYSPEDLEKLRVKFRDGNGTITDQDAIASRDADFQKVMELSELVTTATDMYDRIVKNPSPKVLNPELSTFENEDLQSVYYRLRPSQAEAGYELKQLLVKHNDSVTVDGLSYYPEWQLPIYMQEALGMIKIDPSSTGDTPKAPVSNIVDPFYVSRNPFAPGTVPGTHDYIASKFVDWPEEDARLIINTIKSSQKADDPTTYSFTERFNDHPLLNKLSGEEIDLALKAISDGNYDPSKQTHRRIIAEYLNRFLTSNDDNTISLRTNKHGQLVAILKRVEKNSVKPLEIAEHYGFDTRYIPVSYASKAMSTDEIKRAVASLRAVRMEIEKAVTDEVNYHRNKNITVEQAERLSTELDSLQTRYQSVLEELEYVVKNGIVTNDAMDAGIGKLEDIGDDVKSADNMIRQASLNTDLDNIASEVSALEGGFGIKEPLRELDTEGMYNDPGVTDFTPNNMVESLNKAYLNKNYKLAEQILDQMQTGDYNVRDFVNSKVNRDVLRKILYEMHPIGERVDQGMRRRLYEKILPIAPLLEEPDPLALYSRKLSTEDPADVELQNKVVKATEEVGSTTTGDMVNEKIARLKTKQEETVDDIRKWEIINYDAIKDLNKAYDWNPIEAGKTDPSIQADIDFEKRFINALVHDLYNDKVKATDAYQDIQEQMVYKIAESYYLWDKDHGQGSATHLNDEFTLWMQRRVFPTLTNNNKKGSVYDISLEDRTRMLFTPREILDEYGLFNMVEYYQQNGRDFDINDWSRPIPMFEQPDFDANAPLPKKPASFTDEYLKAYGSGDMDLYKSATYRAWRIIARMLQNGIQATPVRIITAQDVMDRLFPRFSTMGLDVDQKQDLMNFVNATYLAEARKVYVNTNAYNYLLPGTEVGRRFSDNQYYLPRVVAEEIIQLSNRIISTRKLIADLKAKIDDPILAPDSKKPFITRMREIEAKELKPSLRKYNDLLKQFEPEKPKPRVRKPEYGPSRKKKKLIPYNQPVPEKPLRDVPREDRSDYVPPAPPENGDPGGPPAPPENGNPIGPPNPLSVGGAPMLPGKVMVDSLPDIKNIIESARQNIRPMQAQSFEDVSRGLTPELKAQFDEYLRQSKGAMASATQYAHEYGTTKANQALLDYNDRTGFDDWLDVIWPYQFWFTRSMVNWAKRAMNKPAILSKYANRIKHMERMGKDLGKYPVRLQGKMQIPWPFAEEWMGDNVYINPFNELMPVNQILAPLEYLAEAYLIDPTDRLKEMLNEKDITQEEYNKAMEEQSGEHWDLAYKLAEQDMKDRTNPLDLASMMMSPNWLLTEVDALINKKPLRNTPMTNLGFTLESHGDRVKGNGYEIIGDALLNIGKAMQWPEKKIRGERFIAYDKHGVELVMRELSNMAAEGRNSQECLTAMIEQKGPLWIEASERVRDQVSLKTPTSLLAQAMEEGDLTSVPLGLLITMFPAGIFPEGELAQLGLKEEFQSAWTKAGEGDAVDLNAWFDEHPEYLVRSAINDSPRLKMKKYLLNQIMDYYTGQDDKNKALFKEHLGPAFIDKILSGGPVDYDALDIEEMTRWARMAKGNVPETAETAGLTKALPDRDMPNLLTEEEVQLVSTYYEERDRLFPNRSWQTKAYQNLASSREKAVYLAKYPELKQYWAWAEAYKKNVPAITKWTERNADPNQEEYDPYYGINPEIIEGYKREKNSMFPNAQWLNAEYFAIPSDNYNARKQFIAQHPELEAFWTWKKDVEAQSPQIKYYNAQQDAKYEAENAFPVAPADMAPNKIAEALDAMGIDPYVQQDLISYYIQGKPIPYGSLSYLKDMWEKEGSPDTLMEYIDNLF